MVGLLFESEISPATAFHAPASEPTQPLRREQLVDRIVGMNPSATSSFLLRFDEGRLEEYLSHLQAAAEPRGSRWVRPASTPAIVWHEPPAD